VGLVGVNLSGALVCVLGGVLGLILVILVGLDPLVHTVLGSPFALRALVAVLICGLLCLGLGFFFPLGIRVVNRSSPGFLPWAWGINGASP